MIHPVELCVVLPDAPRDFYREFGCMLLDSLPSGFRASLAGDGDPAALDADLLLIVGDCQAFQQLPGMLARAKHRPLTALWLLDSLPPEPPDARSARIGLRTRAYNAALRILRRGMAHVIPFGVRHRLGVSAWSVMAAGTHREFGTESLDARSAYEIVGRYQWLRSARGSGWLDAISVSTPAKKQFLDQVGIRCDVVPVGYHPMMGGDLGLSRDIDVLFIGELDYGRRGRIVRGISERLDRLGVKMTVVSQGCYGDERTKLLNRAKIVLDIPRFPWDFAGTRFLMCMGCGAMVVCEHEGDAGPFVSGEHLAFSDAERIPDVIAHYLGHEDERVLMCDAAARMITTDLTLRRSVERVLTESLATRPSEAYVVQV